MCSIFDFMAHNHKEFNVANIEDTCCVNASGSSIFSSHKINLHGISNKTHFQGVTRSPTSLKTVKFKPKSQIK